MRREPKRTTLRRPFAALPVLAAVVALVPAAAAQDFSDPTTLRCPTDVTATPQEGGAIRLDWVPQDDRTEEYQVQRRVDDGPLDPFHAFVPAPATSFVDQDTEPGRTYTYEVIPTGLRLQSPPDGCARVEAVAIPFFGAPLAAALAGAGALVALRAARRHA